MKKSQSSFYKRFEIIFVKVIPYLFSIHYCWALCQPLFSELIARDIFQVLSQNWPFPHFVILIFSAKLYNLSHFVKHYQFFSSQVIISGYFDGDLFLQHFAFAPEQDFQNQNILKSESKYFPTWSTATESDNQGIPLAVSSLSGKSMSVQ